jgi:hypothetical protein
MQENPINVMWGILKVKNDIIRAHSKELEK